MKRKIFCLILLLCAAVFVFSGCVRMRTTVKFSPFGNVDTEILLMLSEKLGATSSQLEEEIDSYRESGYTVEEYDEEGYHGYIMHKSQSIFDQSNAESEDEMMKASVEGLKVSIDILWDPSDEESQAGFLAAAGELIAEYKGYAEIIMVFPNKPIAHNATSVSEDGKTLTWDLCNLGERTSLHVEISALDLVLGWILIAAGVIVVVIAVVVIIVATKKRKKKAAAA